MVDGGGKSSNGGCGVLMAGSPSVLTPSHSEMDEGKMVVVSANDCDTGASGLRASPEEMTVLPVAVPPEHGASRPSKPDDVVVKVGSDNALVMIFKCVSFNGSQSKNISLHSDGSTGLKYLALGFGVTGRGRLEYLERSNGVTVARENKRYIHNRLE